MKTFKQLMMLVLVSFLMSVVIAQAADVPSLGANSTLLDVYRWVDIPAAMFGAGNVGFIAVLLRWHVQDGPFDFRRALIDPATNAISFGRLGQLTSLVISTEVVVYEAIKGRLSEWLIFAYLATWGAVAVAGKVIDLKAAQSGSVLPSHTEMDPKP